MRKILQTVVKIVILICIILGASLVYLSREEKESAKSRMHLEQNNPKALALKKFLMGFKKPERIEIFNYTKKFERDVAEILKMKIAKDTSSNFYISIQFFTDETDEKAPLVAQIRFLDVKNDNLLKEQSINLE